MSLPGRDDRRLTAKVKICGCMRVEDGVAAADAGAEFVGVMFAQSRRRVSVETARAIVDALGPPLREREQAEPPPLHPGVFDDNAAWFTHGADALERLLARKRPLVVGVFAGQPVDEVNETAEEAGVDLVQLSGGEPWDELLLLTRQAVKVVDTAGVASAADVIARVRPGSALAVMLDASHGAGRQTDPALAADVARAFPIWLAGGLTPENVGAAVATVRPWLVDVSSGVETDGAKDAAKVAAFVRAAKGIAETPRG